jgi:hypothetical protein
MKNRFLTQRRREAEMMLLFFSASPRSLRLRVKYFAPLVKR